jgi:hypothetical protein
MSYDFDFQESDQEVDEILELMRQERIDRGLPPDRPSAFVPMPITCVLMERVAPLRALLIRYALLVNNARKILPIGVEELRQRYIKELTLICESVGVFSSLAGYSMLRSLDQIELAISSGSNDVEDLTRSLYTNFDIGNHLASLSDLNIESSVEDEAEYKRLKSDEALLQSEIDKYSAEYESIRHLY